MVYEIVYEVLTWGIHFCILQVLSKWLSTHNQNSGYQPRNTPNNMSNTISTRTRSVIEAVLYARERYDDQRSFPIYIMMDEDSEAEAMTFQAAQHNDGVEVVKFYTPDELRFGSEDEGEHEVTVEEYVEMFGTRDIDEAIAEALSA